MSDIPGDNHQENDWKITISIPSLFVDFPQEFIDSDVDNLYLMCLLYGHQCYHNLLKKYNVKAEKGGG